MGGTFLTDGTRIGACTVCETEPVLDYDFDDGWRVSCVNDDCDVRPRVSSKNGPEGCGGLDAVVARWNALTPAAALEYATSGGGGPV